MAVCSGGVHGGRVDQQDRNTVLNGIYAEALSAFQAGRRRPQRERLLANRANQNVEQVLRNHGAPF